MSDFILDEQQKKNEELDAQYQALEVEKKSYKYNNSALENLEDMRISPNPLENWD
jgi:hypothetical protein